MAFRWQDKIATGYPQTLNDDNLVVPILSDPFYDDDIWAGDVWISYRKEF